MAFLKPEDLRKEFHSRTNPEDAIRYPNRAAKVLDYIIQKKPFKTKEGLLYIDSEKSEGFIKALQETINKVKVVNLGRETIAFTKTPGDLVHIEGTLGFIEKTAEFGSSGGTGLGSKGTAENEQYTCDTCNYRAHQDSDISNQDTLGYLQSIHGDVSVGTGWVDTFTQTANLIFNSPDFTVKDPEFHYHDNLVQEIERTFKKLSKGSGLGLNKWNPADMWAASRGFKLRTDFQTLDEFNTYLKEAKDHILGISLKKLGKDAHISVFDPADNEKNLFNKDNYEGPVIGKTGRLVIKFNTDTFQGIGSIVFRLFDTISNYEGELNGFTAQGGKVALGSINSYTLSDKHKLPTTSKVEIELTKSFKDEYEQLKQRFHIEQTKHLSLGQNIQMYLNLKLYDYWINLDEEGRQLFLTNLVYHAASRAPRSCRYLKVS